MRHIIAAQKVRYNCSISYNFNGTKVQFYDPYENLNIEGLKLNSRPNLSGPMCFKTVKIPLKRRCFGSKSRVTNLWFSFPPVPSGDVQRVDIWPLDYLRHTSGQPSFTNFSFSLDFRQIQMFLSRFLCMKSAIPGNTPQQLILGRCHLCRLDLVLRELSMYTRKSQSH